MPDRTLKEKLNSVVPRDGAWTQKEYIVEILKKQEGIFGFSAFHQMLWKYTLRVATSRKHWASMAENITGNEAYYAKALEIMIDECIIN